MTERVIDAEIVEERIAVCPICQQKNRLYKRKDRGLYQCGACRATLSNPFARPPKPATPSNNVLFYLGVPVLVLFAALGVLAWISFYPLSPADEVLARKAAERDARIDRLISEIGPAADSPQPSVADSGLRGDADNDASPAPDANETKRAIASLKQQNLPVDADSVASEIAREEAETAAPRVTDADVAPTVVPMNNEILFDAFPDGTFKGELTVENGTSHHAVAKLIDLVNGQKIVSVAVGARQKSTVYAIPDGTYEVVFAFGDRLYEGTDRFFAPHGFSKLVRPMTINTKSAKDAAHRDRLSVTLHPGSAGSAKISSISQTEFERY